VPASYSADEILLYGGPITSKEDSEILQSEGRTLMLLLHGTKYVWLMFLTIDEYSKCLNILRYVAN